MMRILMRGGGDLASGVVIRLWRAGWQVMVAELAHPLAVRRYVSFAQAIYAGEMQIEEVTARRAANLEEAQAALAEGLVPVIVDPDLTCLPGFAPQVVIDGRMRKKPPERGKDLAPLVIGLGPGFTAGIDCHAVVETNRGAYLGRVYWQGQAQADTGVPERVGQYQTERVLRAPAQGAVEGAVDIGAQLRQGDLVARVGGQPVLSPFDGVLRGLIQSGLVVPAGEKIGDVDPRADPRLCWLVSDKALSVGGGVLEAILSWSTRGEVE
jgi:xanthine dehydrogenase accessory factor